MESNTVRMVAIAPLVYNERNVKAGDEFDVEARHAKLLKIVRKARDADAVKETVSPVKPKRGYNRRDMRASAA